MAMIKCDKCGAMLDPKGIKMQHQREGELEIEFFCCGKCGKEYVGFVSDQDMKRRVEEIRKQKLKIQLMNQKKMQKKTIRKEEMRLERMKSKAIKIEQELKRQYQEGKPDGQEATGGIEAKNPTGVQNPQNRGDHAEAVPGHDTGDRGEENRLE